MRQSEVLRHVIGILTQASEWQRLLEEDVERDDINDEADVVTALLNETLPSVQVPADATVEEIAAIVGRELGEAVQQLAGAFTVAFVTLAEVHDSGRQEISSADVLRELALRAEGFDDMDEE
ncbi:hypothetical protein HW130_22985 [Streptomyces sp. PKU-EA00015]|uniref:hypothetical protein n=1 Tax=Streptomyces sp. PKU-EA00015 TaxID=2748326 RepID=UPI0015A093E5|nr:hypothetical protein [Streptomyces sp. PKU-EA00015]NWF29085.1 hypothetical protein [Streptomyces sp. PKU-EA00015]